MAYIVTSPCVGTHDTACMKVCPVDCFYDVPLADLGLSPTAEKPDLLNMLIIDPDVCIHCGLCVPECPVAAIFAEEEVPDSEQAFIDINKQWFSGKDQMTLDAHHVEK